MREDLRKDLLNVKSDFLNHNIKKQIPNLLTSLRLLSPFVLIPLIYYGKIVASIIMVIIFALTDTFDGYLARKYKATSLVGKYLDACVDKVFALSLLIPIILKTTLDNNSYSLVFVNIILEILIGLLNLYSFFKNLQPESTIFGKIKTIFLFTLLAILYLSKIIFIKNLYLLLFIILIIILQIITIISYVNQIKTRMNTVSL